MEFGPFGVLVLALWYALGFDREVAVLKRLLFSLGASLVLAGCASTAPSQKLSGFDGVEMEPWIYGAQAVTGVAFAYPLQGEQHNDIGFCAAQSITNRQISLKDESRSFYGAYTGNYYRVERRQSVDGGEVVMHASQDGKSVATQGSALYQVGSLVPVDKAVRFTLAIDGRGEQVLYRFSNIEVAQLSTSIVQNDGFGKLGAHKEAEPEAALNALKSLSQKIHRCL